MALLIGNRSSPCDCDGASAEDLGTYRTAKRNKEETVTLRGKGTLAGKLNHGDQWDDRCPARGLVLFLAT